jgi:hypothetical protein
VNLAFSGEIWFWTGPARSRFVTVRKAEALEVGDTVTVRLASECDT